MRIREFILESWLNPRDHGCRYNLGASCVKAFTVKELLELTGQDHRAFMDEISGMSLHYGHFFGLERLKIAISKMYLDVNADMVSTVHGGTGANNMVITELVSPGDNVVAMLPNYQQHYSIPESIGAEVRPLFMKKENDYLPDLDELDGLVDSNTKMITMSNPNNPTGSFCGREMLGKISRIADKAGAYILSDEIYRGLDEAYMPSIVDIYERGIATSSTSKVFSMAGTRVGWIIARQEDICKRIANRRSYDTICNGVFDELITAIAFEHYEKILERGRSIVNSNREIFDKWMGDQPHLSTTKKSYSTTAFVTYDYDISTEKLCDNIYKDTGVLLCHGGCFEIPKAFRLGYGFGEPEKFQAGLNVLSDYLASM